VSDPIVLAKAIEEFTRWYLSAAARGFAVDASITQATERIVAGVQLWRTSTTIPTAHPAVHEHTPVTQLAARMHWLLDVQLPGFAASQP
jgi:hypothetical protein